MASSPSLRLDENHLDLRQVFGAIWRHKLIVVLSLIVPTAAGRYYLQHTQPTYQANAQLLVERHDMDHRAPVRHEPAFVATQAELVRSRLVVETALDTFTPSGLDPAKDPVIAVTESINVTPVEGSNVMRVSYSGPDAREAEQMLSALVVSYSNYLSNSEEDLQLGHLEFLTETEQQLRDQLESKQTQYRKFREQSAYMGAGEEADKVSTEYLTDLRQALTETTRRRLQLEHQLAIWSKMSSFVSAKTDQPNREMLGRNQVVSASYLESTEASPMSSPPDSSALPNIGESKEFAEIRALEKQLLEFGQLEKSLDELYGEKHPDLRQARAQSVSVRKRLKELQETIPAGLESELAAAQSEQRAIREIYDREVEHAKLLEIQRLENEQYINSIERLQAVHDSILSEIHSRQLASRSAGKGQGVVHVKAISAPMSTGKPIWPLPKVVYALCGFVGLSLGVGGAIGLDQQRPRRRKTAGPSGGADAESSSPDGDDVPACSLMGT